MEGPLDFTENLGRRLAAYGARLEKTLLPELKTEFRNFATSFATLGKILSKRGYLLEDPYQYEDKFSEVKPIPAENFSESERMLVVSQRMAFFGLQLDFLNETYAFTLDFLTLSRLKNILLLLRFVPWNALSPTQGDPNAKAVGDLVARCRKTDDAIQLGLLNDSLSQLALLQQKIFDKLKTLTQFKREEYKQLVRTVLWPQLNLAAEEVEGNLENVLKKLRRALVEHLKGEPFIPELMRELLDEAFSPQGPQLQKDLLERFYVAPEERNKPKQEVNLKGTLLEAVRVLVRAQLALLGALEKLSGNSAVMEDRVLTLGERLRSFMFSLLGRKRPPLLYEIELPDPVTSVLRSETLNFEEFLAQQSARVKLFASLQTKGSPAWFKLSQKTEAEILDWYQRQALELNKAYERMNALDAFFKTEMPKEKRSLVRGIKPELSSLKSTVANANKLKHEYVAHLEEQEQLKRLGLQHGS